MTGCKKAARRRRSSICELRLCAAAASVDLMRGQLDLRDVLHIGAIFVEDDDLRIGVVAVDLGDDPSPNLDDDVVHV